MRGAFPSSGKSGLVRQATHARGMITQVLADPWEIRDYRDTQTPYCSAGPTPESRRSAGNQQRQRENDLIAGHNKRFRRRARPRPR